MAQHVGDRATLAFERAERRLFASCGAQVASRRVRLADPPAAVRVLEAGDGPPLVLVHGSGMSASTWTPLMPYLRTHHLIASTSPGSASRRLRLQRPIVARARGGPAHLAAGRARPRAGAGRRHLAGRDVGALSGPRRVGSRCRRRVARSPRRRVGGHARRPIPHRALHTRPAPARRADPLAERRNDAPVAGPRRHRPARRRASAGRVLRDRSRGDAPARLPDRHTDQHEAPQCGSADPARRTSYQTPNCAGSRFRCSWSGATRTPMAHRRSVSAHARSYPTRPSRSCQACTPLSSTTPNAAAP